MFAFHLLNCPRGVPLIVLPKADFTTIIIGRGGERAREREDIFLLLTAGVAERESFCFPAGGIFPRPDFAISSFSSRREGGRHPRRTWSLFLRWELVNPTPLDWKSALVENPNWVLFRVHDGAVGTS